MIFRSGLEGFSGLTMVGEAFIQAFPHDITIRVWFDLLASLLTGLFFSPILVLFGKLFSQDNLSYIDAGVYSIAASIWGVIYYYGSFVHDLDVYGPRTSDWYANHTGVGPEMLLFFILCISYICVIFILFYRNLSGKYARYAAAIFSTGAFIIVNMFVSLGAAFLV